MERAVLVYTTWPSIVEAEAAGRSIVEKRLAACVNILPGMISHYWWEGKIERAEEAVMLIKTRAGLAGQVSSKASIRTITRGSSRRLVREKTKSHRNLGLPKLRIL
jgi:uncharacterized protein involved in tolerance to divalent cations